MIHDSEIRRIALDHAMKMAGHRTAVQIVADAKVFETFLREPVYIETGGPLFSAPDWNETEDPSMATP
jgi:hypothetical protein